MSQRHPQAGIEFWRQLDIVAPEHLEFPVTLIGAGGIGSPTALVLTKMGIVDLLIYDDDKVENHNLPSTLYRLKDVGLDKVAALQGICEDYTGVAPKFKSEIFADQSPSGVVISGVDTLTDRHAIWQRIKYNASVQLYIDGRMSGEVFIIHAVNPCDPDDVNWYESTLPSGPEALAEADARDVEPCSARSVVYNTFGIASFIANVVKKYSRSQPYPKEILFDFVNLEVYKRSTIS